MRGRLNAQYIIEGLSAGFLILIAALGFLALQQSIYTSTKGISIALAAGGAVAMGIAYNLLLVFVRQKVRACPALRNHAEYAFERYVC